MSGWKQWEPEEVVEATDFQSFLQNQTVQVYGGTAARSSALGTAVSEGMLSYLTDLDRYEYYTGSAWAELVPAASGTATYAITSGTADYATTSGTAVYATNAGTAVYSTTSGTAVGISGNLAPSQITAGTFSAGNFTFGSALTVIGDTTVGVATTSNTATTGTAIRNVTFSTADPTGGSDGDIWLKYTP
jgi:hypothetical protein